ncbi:uncharacterized protein LOC127078686 [Lathyrus oleraceus]|uniref:uncharacterized protein LOC127078686 n=1 Tax=Pisum sativum TaxID=3888 RepID=UPI0021D3BDA4|nr:uncharacterized protein LOC127078686 [Pisum sativum]
MSKQSALTPIVVSKDDSTSSPMKARVTSSITMVAPSEVVLNVVPLSMLPCPVPIHKKVRTSSAKKAKATAVSKSPKQCIVVKKAHSMISLYVEPFQYANVESNVNTSTKEAIGSKHLSRVEPSASFVSEKVNPNVNEAKKVSIDKSIRRLVATVLKETRSGDTPDVTTSLHQAEHPAETIPENPIGGCDNDSISTEYDKDVSPDNLVSMTVEEKQDVSGEEENPSRRKEKYIIIVNIDELNSDEETIAKNLSPDIAKRMKNRRIKAVMNEGMPSKIAKKKDVVGPTKIWSKVGAPTKKRKEISYSESNYDVEHDVQDIIPQKKVAVRKIHVNVLKVPLDNISFHSIDNVEKCQRRLALERELGQDALKCKEVM